MFVSKITAIGNDARRLYNAMEDRFRIPSIDFRSMMPISIGNNESVEVYPTHDGISVKSKNWVITFEYNGQDEVCEVSFIYARESDIQNVLARFRDDEGSVLVEDIECQVYSPQKALRKLTFMRRRRGILSRAR
jgi:hypothetical protein